MAAPRTTTIVYNTSFNPNYDIVWSVQFLLSGSVGGSGAFTTFLTDRTTLTTPGTGVDVGYSGVIGLTGAQVCVGFDTSGLFASRVVYPDSSIRTGLTGSNIKPNMLVIRGGYPDFNLLYSSPLSALSDTFNLLSYTENYQTLRFRLGNIGRVLYVDWRDSDNSSYTQLTSLNVNLSVTDSTSLYIGYSYTTPVSTTNGWKETDLYLRQPVYEGINTPPQYTNMEYTPLEIELCTDCLLPTQYYTVSAEIPPAPVYPSIKTYIVFTDCSEGDRRILYSNANGQLETGVLFVDNTLQIPYDGQFAWMGNLYTSVGGSITLVTPCTGS